MVNRHDLNDFIAQVQKDIADEYDRIFRRASEDPGTAGDEGEETWRKILSEWLPNSYQVVTKGRVMNAQGESSGQMDILVLSPSYPPFLIERKQYLAPGVVAAFECKLTLRREGILTSVRKGAELRRMLIPELSNYPPPFYGVLAHSHAWRNRFQRKTSERISRTIAEAEQQYVLQPVECLDALCLANLGTWTLMRLPSTTESSELSTCLMGPSFHPETDAVQSTGQPVGRLLTYLMRRLANRKANDLAALAQYFRDVNLDGFGVGQPREWETDTLPETTPRILY